MAQGTTAMVTMTASPVSDAIGDRVTGWGALRRQPKTGGSEASSLEV